MPEGVRRLSSSTLNDAVAVAHDVEPGDRDPRARSARRCRRATARSAARCRAAARDDAVAHDPRARRRRRARTAPARARAARSRPTARATARVDQPRDRVDAKRLHPVGGPEADSALLGSARDRVAELAQVVLGQRLAQAALVLARTLAAARALLERSRCGEERNRSAPRPRHQPGCEPRGHGQPAQRPQQLYRCALRHALIVLGGGVGVVRLTSKMAQWTLDGPRAVLAGRVPNSIAAEVSG